MLSVGMAVAKSEYSLGYPFAGWLKDAVDERRNAVRRLVMLSGAKIRYCLSRATVDEFGETPSATGCDQPTPSPSRGMRDGSRVRRYHRGVDRAHPV